jgi:hypothetical protein
LKALPRRFYQVPKPVCVADNAQRGFTLVILSTVMLARDGFLFSDDREQDERDREKERRSQIYGTPEFWHAYDTYTQSPQWKALCRQVKARAKNRCENCGDPFLPSRGFGVHHITYDRFRNERLSDLLFLCELCHRAADREREKRNQQAYEAAGEEAREAAWKNSYFTTKYGEDWWQIYGDDPQALEEDFQAWRERKQEEQT